MHKSTWSLKIQELSESSAKLGLETQGLCHKLMQSDLPGIGPEPEWTKDLPTPRSTQEGNSTFIAHFSTAAIVA